MEMKAKTRKSCLSASSLIASRCMVKVCIWIDFLFVPEMVTSCCERLGTAPLSSWASSTSQDSTSSVDFDSWEAAKEQLKEILNGEDPNTDQGVCLFVVKLLRLDKWHLRIHISAPAFPQYQLHPWHINNKTYTIEYQNSIGSKYCQNIHRHDKVASWLQFRDQKQVQLYINYKP